MNQNKQIEEIRNIIETDCDFVCEKCEFNGKEHCFICYCSNALYNAGYRKQSKNTVEVTRCEKCRYWENGVCYNEAQKYLFTDKNHYCSYGTKMKGGAE